MNQEELNKILKAHKDWIEGREGGVRAVLIGASINGADLRWAVLSGANLCKADLSGANLYRAKLDRANLYRANLRGANLRGANLRGANLSGANLSEADLSGADLSGANLSGAILPPAPKRPVDLLQRIAAIIRRPGALIMREWHCGTSHCLAGWAVELTPGGKEFEEKTSTYLAGRLLVPELEPYFYGDNETALEATKKYLCHRG